MKKMIKVTEQAAEKLKKMFAEQKNPNKNMVRINFGGFGWGGPKIGLTLDEFKNENDKIVELQGIKVIYMDTLENYISNSVIDYSDSFFSRGFSIKGTGLSSC